MRRPVTHAVDVSETLLRLLLGFRGDGSLPTIAAAILVYLGQKPGNRASMADIQQRLRLPQQGTSYHCRFLVRKGFARRIPGAEDRRSAELALTAKGLRRIDKK